MKLKHEIGYDGQQRPILEPLLFNMELIDLLFEFENHNTVSYADDTTPHTMTHSSCNC